MRIDATAKCRPVESCEDYSPIFLGAENSLVVDRTNTLHQFDTAGIVGVPSPVGKVPIVFYVKESERGGRRGILYYDDYDSVCFMYPEDEHSEWCVQPYDMKYDALVPFDNGVERGLEREHGILELWVTAFRKWYNGEIMYRPRLKIQGCGRREGGYPTKSEAIVLKEEPKRRVNTRIKKQRSHSCNCGKGA